MWKMYGITRCSTVQKARDWLSNHDISFEFQDFKQHGIPEKDLLRWMNERGWEKIINRASLTWRHFDEADKEAVVDANSALVLAKKNPSVIRRPLLVREGELIDIGFNEKRYESLFDDQ
jgi:Spx/MgsR family transcriptional regulator